MIDMVEKQGIDLAPELPKFFVLLCTSSNNKPTHGHTKVTAPPGKQQKPLTLPLRVKLFRFFHGFGRQEPEVRILSPRPLFIRHRWVLIALCIRPICCWSRFGHSGQSPINLTSIGRGREFESLRTRHLSFETYLCPLSANSGRV
jgi:hypothetical protein